MVRKTGSSLDWLFQPLRTETCILVFPGSFFLQIFPPGFQLVRKFFHFTTSESFRSFFIFPGKPPSVLFFFKFVAKGSSQKTEQPVFTS